MTKTVKRKLTCVFCADVKSYSNLMERDEAGTLETLHRYRKAMDGLVDRHDGRIINTWGDAVFAEFGSVVEAVQCAVEIQRELSSFNLEMPKDRQMWFRIGINLGDVMVDGDDLYGEGVNIAARLQEVAEPGGIAVSGSVHEQVRNKMVIGFDYLGQQSVRNLSDPVSSYRVVLDRNAPPEEELPPQSTPKVPPQTDQSAADEAVRETDRERKYSQGWHNEDISSFFAENGKLSQWIGKFRGWYRVQDKVVQRTVGLIGFLFVINILSTGLSPPWFLWPSAVLGLLIFWRHRRGNRGGDQVDGQ